MISSQSKSKMIEKKTQTARTTTPEPKLYGVSSGRSYPLGATVHEHGVNLSLFSANAEKVELCLFDS